MRVSPDKIKICEKHLIPYTNIGNKNKRYCKQCRMEYYKSPERLKIKREHDRKYVLKKKIINPDSLKQAQEKYRNSEKGKEKNNNYKLQYNQGKHSNLYCIKCNENRVYGNNYCDDCDKILHVINNYDYISLCKHCNKEYGLDVKISNIGKVFQLNRYCSIECNKESSKIIITKNRKIYNRKHRRIRDDKEMAKLYGIKYEHINRTLVYRKHNYICTSCNVKCVHPNKDNYNQSNAATLDHIIPKSKGGSHTYDNVTLLCRSCNTIKSDKMFADYKIKQSQLELEFIGYLSQGLQLELQM